MELVLISVPYTGTNFTAKLFTDRGFQRLGMLESPVRENSIHVAHALKETQVGPALKLAETMPVILPLRHPFRCEESTRRMGGSVEQMIEGYENLFRFEDPYFMPVDSPKKFECLDQLREGLGVPVKTDWEVVSSKVGVHKIPFDELTPSNEVIELMTRHTAFFSSYYAGSG